MTSKSTEELASLFSKLREKALTSGASLDEIKQEFTRQVKSQNNNNGEVKQRWSTSKKTLVLLVFPVLLAVGCYYGTLFLREHWKEEMCLININEIFNEIVRKPTNCSMMCEGLDEVPRVSGLTKETFIEKYAYTGRPAVVIDAAKNWSALHTFNFEFLKNLYDTNDGAYQTNEDECQFFPYKTNFTSLKAAFNMSKERSQFKAEPWYFGWSNCDPIVREKLREHYQRPYFLPADSETSQQDWLFMGGPGLGAQIHEQGWHSSIARKRDGVLPPSLYHNSFQILHSSKNTGTITIIGEQKQHEKDSGLETGVKRHHASGLLIDSVERPSWQAQLSGSKVWTLIPPPECEHVCKSLKAPIHKGEVILVDTNQWFHKTEVLPGEISITIGAEYD